MNVFTCESVAAIVVHLREPGPKGFCSGGGADTPALCGAKVAWDTRIPFEAVTCRRCRVVVGLPEYPVR